jgi:competence protein CoiA
MQFYAFDGDELILASSAQKQKNYRCPECLNPLRIRGGPHRQIHFYHLKTTPLCRQHKKSLTHLQIQWAVKSLFSSNEVVLERPFPEVKRIADIFIEKYQMVIEIQCSPISAQEAEARNRDYRSLGLHPVWILYDKRYNRRHLSAAEHYLRQNPCYFTNGQGLFYDQADLCRGFKRISRGVPLKILLNAPQFDPHLHFSGDRIDRGISLPIEKPLQKLHFVKRLYRSFFHLLLENVK